MIVHEHSAERVDEESCILRAGSVTQDKHVNNGQQYQFRSPLIAVKHSSPQSQLRVSIANREIFQTRQELSPSAGCLKRKDLSHFVLNKVIKAPENMMQKARERISRSVHRNKTIDFPNNMDQGQLYLESSVASRGPLKQAQTPSKSIRIDDHQVSGVFLNSTILNGGSKSNSIQQNAYQNGQENKGFGISRNAVSPKVQQLMATLEERYSEQTRLLENLNHQKEQKLQQIKDSLTETQNEKAELESKIRKFTQELQDRRATSERAEASVNQLTQK